VSTAIASPGRDREHSRRPIAVAWGLWLLALTADLLTYMFFVAPDPTRSPAIEAFDWATGWLPFMAFLTVGTLIVARRPGNVVGWLCCAIGAVVSFSGFGSSDAARSIAADPDRVPGAAVLHLLGQVLYLIPMLGLLPVLVLVFPTGRLPSRRWRPVLWIVTAGLALYVASIMLKPGPAADGLPANPLGVAAADRLLGPMAAVSGLLFGVFVVLVLASLVVRFRRARGEERQQLKWLVYGVILLALLIPTLGRVVEQIPSPFAGPVFAAVMFSIIPVAIGLAILKYRLYDIDRVISRTLAYALLTALLAGLYAGVSWSWASCSAASAHGRRAGRWPLPPWPWPACSSPPVGASRPRLTAASTGASTTPPGPWRPSAPGFGMRSTWARSRPTCWRWSTRQCSPPLHPCGSSPQFRSSQRVKAKEARLTPTELDPLHAIYGLRPHHGRLRLTSCRFGCP
jgi:hypothetical protein